MLKALESDEVQAKAAAEKKAADDARLAAENAKKAEDERTSKKAKLQQELEAEMQNMRKMFEEKMKQLDEPSGGSAKPAAATPIPVPTPTPAPATPVPSPTPKGKHSAKAATPAPATPEVKIAAIPPPGDLPLPAGSDATDIPLKDLPPPPGPSKPAATPAPALALAPTAEAPLLALNKPVPGLPFAKPEPKGPDTSKATFESSIGLKFAPVGDVLFAVFPTRLQDFDLFVKETNFKGTTWRNPGFKQAADHPVVNVSWNDAMAFCKWLTERDRKKGILSKTEAYRLPTDLEWSKGVGLPDESGKTPEARDMGVADVFPWGTQWPPPPNAGNYTGEETGSDVAIKGYEDGFAWTSPVGSFPPNKYGLYDMGGNVWQWCMDDWNNDAKATKVLRGASWYNGALKLSLLSSCRVHAKADSSTDNYGFRIVKAPETTPAPTAKKKG